ncbi:crossover junction endodeoxyribonuclease RuvC [bacterium]|nr:crossover junction endodeoxyribonuclease RuvC [bacterium]
MLILGIDPGTIKLGYGLINVSQTGKLIYVDSGVIASEAKKKVSFRLGVILDNLEDIIKKYKPNILALESSFYTKNMRTVISLGEARGVILSLAGRYDIDVREFAPTAIKQSIAGGGRADKDRIQKMVKMILGLVKEMKHEDESDALATALCCYYRKPKYEGRSAKDEKA